jgi:drug/metabolite transporter (DMT)-like permease
MTLPNLILILASAVVHVAAHVAIKRARDRTAFVWWMLFWGGVLFLPLAVLRWQALSLAAVLMMVGSAIFEALYFYAIARAYRHGDLSVVYPLARGMAPLFLLIWSTLLLSDRVTLGGAAGIALIALGLYLINLPRLGAWSRPLRSLGQPGPRWALLAGLSISLYTLIDRFGIQLVDPLLYTYLALWITVGLLTPITLREAGQQGLRLELNGAAASRALPP